MQTKNLTARHTGGMRVEILAIKVSHAKIKPVTFGRYPHHFSYAATQKARDHLIACSRQFSHGPKKAAQIFQY